MVKNYAEVRCAFSAVSCRKCPTKFKKLCIINNEYQKALLTNTTNLKLLEQYRERYQKLKQPSDAPEVKRTLSASSTVKK